jgi:hypothetical protein
MGTFHKLAMTFGEKSKKYKKITILQQSCPETPDSYFWYVLFPPSL